MVGVFSVVYLDMNITVTRFSTITATITTPTTTTTTTPCTISPLGTTYIITIGLMCVSCFLYTTTTVPCVCACVRACVCVTYDDAPQQ